MTEDRSPPPEAEACLCRRYPSSQKGGTLICPSVTDLATHDRWLASGRYRPARCPRCGAETHVHDYRLRWMREDPATSRSTEVARFRCARRACRAVWQVLPAFLARHLWRAWQTVERVVLRPPAAPDDEPAPAPESPIPLRTRQRWAARLASAGRTLVVALAAAGSSLLAAVAGAVGLQGTRGELVEQYLRRVGGIRRGERLAALAEHVHRIAPGLRLM